MAQVTNDAQPDQRLAVALIRAGLVSNASTTRFKALADGRLAPRKSFPWAGVIVTRLPNG